MEIKQDMYDKVTAKVKMVYRVTEEFLVGVGLHQGFALNPYLFVTVMDSLTLGIQNEIPWCMLFADDTILVSEIRSQLNNKLQ